MKIGVIDFQNPRQKMWGILKTNILTSLPYGQSTDDSGNIISSYSTNSYTDALDQVHDLIAQGTASSNIQIVEFVPYDYTIQPRV
ncbi:hypothetical protein psyc5s11_29920 [Clostridium gelidum]|uniref:Uncharacterized protein n=1 Tax=Clostridium gelidum TaxID=704125 RepID=A0ABM7T4S4_9CLOT|nr:hypothetical protein [Clostridium gelidum]BCZ46925.1 hypothetical protein psyc5s11_29920 [Clostridium gelidum]